MPGLVASPDEGSSQHVGHGSTAGLLPSTQGVVDAPQPPQLTGQHHERVQPNENNLDLTDVSSDLSWLSPLINDDGNGSSSTVSPPEPTSSNINNPSEIPAPTPPQPTTDDTALRPQPTVSVTSPKKHISTHQPRKPAPGLAARLKALGIGAAKTTLTRPTFIERDVGRLSEDQIRQIEEYHRQHEPQPTIERRGRPWKGVVRIPSKASLKSAKSNKDVVTPEDVNVPAIQILDSPGTEEPSDLTPEFETPEPLDMDLNKYRLPDHTNDNGTKVTLDTRREHIERDTRPPPSPESEEPDSEETPPPVPAKDTPPPPAQQFNPEDYFNPLGLQRAGSIYTISRASFANQLAQLTSLQLPDAESLAGKIAAIPTAQAASKALIGAAEQIRSWIFKASEVISGLDSDDDVEWSAAGGREGLEEVEGAATRFEELINVYVTAIEELQGRDDIGNVSAEDLTRAVSQMEAIMVEWTNIRKTLRSVRGQVEIAMEWEELWNLVLGEISTELEELCRLVFEMEERRHKSVVVTANGDSVDIGDLDTIVEEKPRSSRAQAASTRLSLTGLPASPGGSPGGPTISQDDSSLLALFARMQPLRASLDFLPMRLSVFEARAEKSFPTACDELDMRRENLDASYRKLEKDAEGLRKELGEDRWVLVFRGAARQAQKMSESVERSMAKLGEAVDTGMHLTNLPAFLKKVESYEAKRTHYGPAIDRVLLIIERGVKDRLTVNGEILRMSVEMQSRWEDLKNQMKELDFALEGLHADRRGTQLRDSVSSLLSNDMSSNVGSGLETPQSSPPSSVIMSGLGIDTRTPGAKMRTASRTRRSSSSVSSQLPQPGRRSTSANAPTIPRKPVARLSTVGGLTTPSRERSASSTGNRLAGSIPRPASTMAHRPKWNASVNTSNLDVGHNFKPLSLTTPSPYSRKNMTTPNSMRSHSSLAAPIGSRLPIHSPLRATSPSPNPDHTPSKPPSTMSFRDRLAASGSRAQQSMSKFRPEGPSGRRTSLQPPRSDELLGLSPRPASSLATTNRRASMLPQPNFRKQSTAPGRETPVPPGRASRLGAPGRESPMPPGRGSRLGLGRKNSTCANDREKPRFRM